LKLEELEVKFQKERILKMVKCTFCGKMYDVPRGMTVIKNDGTIQHFCSAKCRKNKKMKRRKVRWISKKKKVKE